MGFYLTLLRLLEISHLNEIRKGKRYLKRGEYPPRGYSLHTGKRNGKYILTRKRSPTQTGSENKEKNKKPELIEINPAKVHDIIGDLRVVHRRNHHNLLFSDQYFQHRKDLTDDEKVALLSYQDNSTEINQYMRGVLNNVSPEVLKKINNIKMAFSRNDSFIPGEFLLYKGISADFAKIIIDNFNFSEHAFFSSTYDPVRAIAYAYERDRDHNVKDTNEYANILVYDFPGGKGIFLGNHSEILLPEKSKWKVIYMTEVNRLKCLHEDINYNIRKKIRLIYIERISDIHG